jgi:hypothetical protein
MTNTLAPERKQIWALKSKVGARNQPEQISREIFGNPISSTIARNRWRIEKREEAKKKAIKRQTQEKLLIIETVLKTT